MHFINGLPWIPNLGAQRGLTTDYLLFFVPINRKPIIELISFFQNNVIRELKKALKCSIPHYTDVTNNTPISFSYWVGFIKKNKFDYVYVLQKSKYAI